MKCISDRIQNYLEMFMDRMKDGYEYDEQETHYKLDEDGTPKKSWFSNEPIAAFGYIIRRKRKPFIKTDLQDYEKFRKDVMDFYLNEVRGEIEYTNKNPRTVAASILYRFLGYQQDFTFPSFLHLCEISSPLTIKKLFKPIATNYELDIFHTYYEYEKSIPLYCTLSNDYKCYQWEVEDNDKHQSKIL